MSQEVVWLIFVAIIGAFGWACWAVEGAESRHQRNLLLAEERANADLRAQEARDRQTISDLQLILAARLMGDEVDAA